MKIEFNPWKVVVFFIEFLFWVPLLLAVDYTIGSLFNIELNNQYWYLWLLMFMIFWRWITWGYQLHKFYEEMHD
jgi:hypothetical protein